MAADTRELMAMVEGDRPSPAFVARLRSRLEDELDAAASVDGDGALLVETDLSLGVDADRGRRRGRWWMGGLVLAAAVTLLIALVAIDRDDVDTSAIDTTAPAGSDGSGLSQAAARQVVESYYASVSAGDFSAIRDGFAPGATVIEAITQNVEHHVQIMAWFHQQGSFLTERDCSIREENPGTFVVVCGYLLHEYLEEAVGAPPPATTDLFTVTEDGVTRLLRRYESVGFLARRAFGVWMEENHPGVVHDVPATELPSIEEAMEAGIQRREYADLWARYLLENECSYLVDC